MRPSRGDRVLARREARAQTTARRGNPFSGRGLVLVAGATLLGACGPDPKTGDCTDNLISGDLVITEVFADSKAPPGGSGTDEGKEWFEIYNASDRPIELTGMTIVHSRVGGTAKSHVIRDVTIAPGQFFTLGNSADDLLPAYVDYGYGPDLGDLFNTDGGRFALSCGSKEIDAATYESVKEGRSRQLTAAQPPDYTLNDDPLSWCEANGSEFDVGNFGTPGSENDCTPIVIGQCNDAGTMRDAVLPAPGDLIITEVMPNPAAVSDTEGEWFEIYAVNGFDLNGVGLDRAGDTANPNIITSVDCIHVNAGSYAVFAKNADSVMNGGVPAATIRAPFTFALVDGTAAAPGDVRIMAGTNVIDAITWTSTRSGRSHALDPDILDATGNDQESNFCDGSTVFGGGDQGTPGMANVQCGGTTAGMCNVAGTPRPIVKPTAGQVVITEFLANPAGTVAGVDAAQEWFEITNTGGAAFDLNGLGLKGSAATINLIVSTDCKSVPAAGFAVFAHGTDPMVNGGLPLPDATFTFSMGNTSGSLSVLDGATPLDVVTWTSGITDGATDQLLPANTNATDNDAPPANFCKAKAPQTYGATANFGTPGALNVCL